jgi:hypothetical protein
MAAVHSEDLLGELQAQAEREAYNAAFEELGLNWFWDAHTYAGLPQAGGAQRVRSYLEREHAHLLRAYEADFLVTAIEAAKDRCLAAARSPRERAAHHAGAPR